MMVSQRPHAAWALLWLLAALLGRCAAQLIPVDYCAVMNTATMNGNRSDFQSQGLCRGFCNVDGNALAIVKGNFCWCSTVVPSKESQLDIDECGTPCPGYPSDVCGSNTTWVYMLLNAQPSNTAVGLPVTASSPSSNTNKPTPVVSTVTREGTVIIVTSTPSDTGNPSSDPSSGGGQGGGGLTKGAAGGIGGAVAGIVVIALVIGFVVMRRRRRRDREAMLDGASPGGSAAGMAHVRAGSAAAGSGRFGRRGTDGAWESDTSERRRASILMPSDPRMNAVGGLYARPDNKSNDSFLSMADNQDYSRRVHEPKKVLRVTNADPDEGPGPGPS